MRGTTQTKTTITISSNVLKGLRIYMAKEGLGLHDQSKVIAEALSKYLIEKGIQIDPDNGLAYDYEIVLKADE